MGIREKYVIYILEINLWQKIHVSKNSYPFHSKLNFQLLYILALNYFLGLIQADLVLILGFLPICLTSFLLTFFVGILINSV